MRSFFVAVALGALGLAWSASCSLATQGIPPDGQTFTGAGGSGGAAGPTSTGSLGGNGGGGPGGRGGGAACPCAKDTACLKHACDTGPCVDKPVALGTVVPDAKPGDCQKTICDGTGKEAGATDDADVPPPPNDCSVGSCAGGHVGSIPKMDGIACGMGGPLRCHGGQCLGCTVAADCGADTLCKTFACNGGTCGSTTVADNMEVANTSMTDCVHDVCLGGIQTTVANDSETPTPDGNPCDGAVCVNGMPRHPQMQNGMPCGNAMVCNNGTCAQCAFDQNCKTPCDDGTCGNGTCVPAPKSDGADCGGGKFCFQGQCSDCGVAGNCQAGECQVNPQCNNGTCAFDNAPDNSTKCAAGFQKCCQGTCCNFGQHCAGGQCCAKSCKGTCCGDTDMCCDNGDCCSFDMKCCPGGGCKNLQDSCN